MSHQCIKCDKNFRSKYHLDRHVNKQIPCGTTLKCNRCNKIFDHRRELDRHKLRKTPCKIINTVSELELKLQIEKEKTLRVKIEKEKELEIVKAKSKKNIMEKNKQKEKEIEIIKEKSKKAIIEKDKQKEKEIEVIKEKNKKFDKQKDIEKERTENSIKLIQEKSKLKDKSLAVEREKTARKEKTPQIINNNTMNNINITNNNTVIQYITNKYAEENRIIFPDMKRMVSHNSCSLKYIRDKLYDRANNLNEMAEELIAFVWKNEDNMHNSCLFYNKQTDKFYGFFKSDKIKEKKPKIKTVKNEFNDHYDTTDEEDNVEYEKELREINFAEDIGSYANEMVLKECKKIINVIHRQGRTSGDKYLEITTELDNMDIGLASTVKSRFQNVFEISIPSI